MDYRTKHAIVTVILAFATLSAVIGFWRLGGEVLAGHMTKLSLILLFGGAFVGVASGITRLYLKARIPTSSDLESQRAALEALAAIGKKRAK